MDLVSELGIACHVIAVEPGGPAVDCPGGIIFLSKEGTVHVIEKGTP